MSPANDNVVVELTRGGYGCTYAHRGEHCTARSPDGADLAVAAVVAGWRTWHDDTALYAGEALCPLHRDEPMRVLLQQPPF